MWPRIHYYQAKYKTEVFAKIKAQVLLTSEPSWQPCRTYTSSCKHFPRKMRSEQTLAIHKALKQEVSHESTII
jgi:hypothetical protein